MCIGSYWITIIWCPLAGILGGGFLLGSVVMIMEDADAPHHLLLLRCFMSQGVVHKQPLLFSGAMKEPRLFLGTLPAPVSSSKEDGRHRAMGAAASSDGRANVGLQNKFINVLIVSKKWSSFPEIFIIQDEGLRIAWQYKKYFGDDSRAEHKGGPFTPSLNLVCSVIDFFFVEPCFSCQFSWLRYDMECCLKRREIY